MSHNRVSTINLVDLAGSERVAATQTNGDRLKVKFLIAFNYKFYFELAYK